MKTNGGYWEEGMAIYDAIKACPNPVTILNYTHARSMSSLIFQAANKRVMMKHSKYMYHEGTWAFEGTMRQARTEIIEANSTNRQMLDVYIEVMKRDGKMKKWSKKKIEQYLMEQMLQKEEVYLNAKETVTCGLADVIFGEEGSYNWAELVEYTDEQLRR
jgi:ATP-dependent protease ClpP protease subunit